MPANRQNNPSFFGTLPTFTATQAGDVVTTPVKTIGESQSTPANPLTIVNDDSGYAWAPTSPGTGAGKANKAANSVGPDDTPPTSTGTTQQAINTAFANQPIVAQPNVLDQYASYTYAISWWLLSPTQYNNLSTAGPAPGTGNWSLLMQTAGAPIAGRSQTFPYDYYLDDLEIETQLAGKGTGMSTNGMSLKFKVVEPNGLTLLQNLFKAVDAVYKNPTSTTAQQVNAGATPRTIDANQSNNQTVNYPTAQYCLTVEFYGYDGQGNLVAPAKGQYSPTGQLSTGNAQAVIKKYYPFTITNITFRTVANQIEYYVEGRPIPYDTATSQARGTIPFGFALAGQTVGQILQGGPLTATNTVAQTDRGARTTTPAPAQSIGPAIASATSRDGLATSILGGGSIDPETGSVGYAFGA